MLRLDQAKKYATRHRAFERTGDSDKDFRFVWVNNFPMFEWSETDRRWMAAHHPFTSPHEKDMPKLNVREQSLRDPDSLLRHVKALAYDIVLNGTELGSGSIRIHRQEIQNLIFRTLGMTQEQATARFGFFLDALQFGTPPHGGIALGLDRIVMILAGAESLREVIPFPKTARAVDLMVDAPTPVSRRQLRELGIDILHFGEFFRRTWLEKLPKSLELKREKARVYVNKMGHQIGLPAAREVRPNTWKLELPREFDQLVLLCQSETGQILDFVLPAELVARLWPTDQRTSSRRRTQVARDGQRYFLKVQKGDHLEITQYLGKLDFLRD